MTKQILSIILIFSLSILLGCAGSVPRFKSKDQPPKQTQTEEKEYRFSYEKAKKEEIAEDDKKVDIPTVKEKFLHPTGATTPSVVKHDKVLTEVLGLIGTPYSYSGNDDKGIDCSGFTGKVYEKSMGIKLPRSTDGQYRVGKNIPEENLLFGDLVFFNTTGRNPSHVGIYLGDDLFAHASLSMGVTVSSLQSSYYKKRYVGARRVVE